MTQAVALAQQASTGVSQGFKNRIINGAMVIDQRNAGASVTGNDNVYGVDRFRVQVSQSSKFTMQQNAGSVTPPAGFTNYLGITSSSAYSVTSSDYFFLQQRIEGYNVADLDFGKSTAKTITISFWVRSSLTGTFGGVLGNSAFDRSYPYTYTINAANTWEYKTITIAGDTTGTWVGATNGLGLRVRFGLGVGSDFSGTAGAWAGAGYSSATGATSVVGTNGATFYITGVQLEVGSTATSFDYRPYGTELALCQRYYYRLSLASDGDRYCVGFNQSTTSAEGVLFFKNSMRIAPTALEQTGTASNYSIINQTTNVSCSAVPAFSKSSTDTATVTFTVASGLTAGNGSMFRSNASNTYLAWSAEL